MLTHTHTQASEPALGCFQSCIRVRAFEKPKRRPSYNNTARHLNICIRHLRPSTPTEQLVTDASMLVRTPKHEGTSMIQVHKTAQDSSTTQQHSNIAGAQHSRNNAQLKTQKRRYETHRVKEEGWAGAVVIAPEGDDVLVPTIPAVTCHSDSCRRKMARGGWGGRERERERERERYRS